MKPTTIITGATSATPRRNDQIAVRAGIARNGTKGAREAASDRVGNTVRAGRGRAVELFIAY
jgi:hypothetical protein